MLRNAQSLQFAGHPGGRPEGEKRRAREKNRNFEMPNRVQASPRVTLSFW
jgi:hypothetical protein